MGYNEQDYEFDVNLQKLYERLNPLRDFINLDTNLEETYRNLRCKSIKYNPEEFLKQNNFIVYILWKYVKETKMHALYVGKSYKGIRRTFIEKRNEIDIFENADELEVIPCLHKEIADELEIKLIFYFRPSYNERHKDNYLREERIITR